MPTDTATLLPYKVRMGDTLQCIAARMTGSADNWKQIASYNGLDYPYITNYKSVAGPIFAQGVVTFYVSPGVNINIPKDTTVAVPAVSIFGTNQSYPELLYSTTVAVDLTVTTTEISVLVKAQRPGDEFNVFPRRISLIKNATLVAAGVKVRNDAAFTSGANRTLAAPGDMIFVPIGITVSTKTYSSPVPTISSNEDWQDRVLGADASLIQSGLFGIQSLGQIANDMTANPSTGDAALYTGLNNLAQALTHRLTTRRGELLGDPSYGSLFPLMIGRPATTGMPKLMALEAKETLSKDPRILAVLSVNVVNMPGGVFYINARVMILGRDTPVVLNLIMPAGA